MKKCAISPSNCLTAAPVIVFNEWMVVLHRSPNQPTTCEYCHPLALSNYEQNWSASRSATVHFVFRRMKSSVRLHVQSIKTNNQLVDCMDAVRQSFYEQFLLDYKHSAFSVVNVHTKQLALLLAASTAVLPCLRRTNVPSVATSGFKIEFAQR